MLVQINLKSNKHKLERRRSSCKLLTPLFKIMKSEVKVASASWPPRALHQRGIHTIGQPCSWQIGSNSRTHACKNDSSKHRHYQ
ncbi:hypothetical protein DUNSADRAFT_862 [Dunaliella salina]|uniref:Encoded protein n=1 Tax=Dunaliella salina TaxID=3046 RepID=A0ABQ7FY96_DUNSA|nr:hypothetical protein DUNSADRAFT_862 [Dunaliella salina]|eukprot:KAF5827317.1 hypothetical protein DUNSADRAFT_862 [Dunaliella salina]